MTDYHPITAAIRDALIDEEHTADGDVVTNLPNALLVLAAAIDRLATRLPD